MTEKLPKIFGGFFRFEFCWPIKRVLNRLTYQPAMNRSPSAAARSLAIGLVAMPTVFFRRFIATTGLASAAGKQLAAAGDICGSSAKALRGVLMTGMSAIATGGGVIVGRLVSKTIASGHLCIVWIRIVDRSTLARSDAADGFGMYQSERNKKASTRLPANPKYRPRGIVHHC